MPPRKRQPVPGTPTIEVQNVHLDTLLTDPANARMHDRRNIDAIAASLRRFGQQRPLVVDETRVIVAGNGTYAAMRQEGWEWCDVIFFPGNAAEARAFAIADNRTAELASWDTTVLAQTLRLMDGPLMAAAGFDENDLAHLINDLPGGSGQPGGGDGDPDDAPPTRAKAVSKVGDLWELGEHRLAVGDCTDPTVVETLMAGERADCMWTDPPYGVEVVGGDTMQTKDRRRASGGKSIQNDGEAGLPALLAGAFAGATAALSPGSPVYIAHPAGALSHMFQTQVMVAGWRWAQTLIWVKNRIVPGRSDYHYQHEPILYGFTPADPGSGRRGRGGQHWYGNDAQTTIFEYSKPTRSEDHPTMKPVGLVQDCLRNSTPPDGLVFDPFAGSGTTLIAAHLLGRRARVIELDPAYADVICRRYYRQTKVAPTRAGKPFPGLA